MAVGLGEHGKLGRDRQRAIACLGGASGRARREVAAI